MNRTIKIILITLGSLFAGLLVVVSVFSWVIFTPEKLTPLVQNQLNKYLICESSIGKVELTFFSTFPAFGLMVDGLTLKNPMSESPSDTVFSTEKIIASIDLKKLWKENKLLVSHIAIQNPVIVAFIDSVGVANFDVLKKEEETDHADSSELPFSQTILDEIDLSNAQVIYHDQPTDMVISMLDMDAIINLTWEGDQVQGALDGDVSSFSFYWDEVDYVNKSELQLSTPFAFHLNKLQLNLDAGTMALNKMDFALDVMIQYLADHKDMVLDVNFASNELPVASVFDILSVPFGEYLEGIAVDGLATINGSLTGVVGDSVLPVFSIQTFFHDGNFAYEGLPYSLLAMTGNAEIEMDLNNSDLWYVKVDDFEAKTGQSYLTGSAYVDQLVGDMRFDIQSKGDLNLVDVYPMLPDDVPLVLEGLASGTADIQFLYSHFMQNEFDKMHIKGDFSIADLTLQYDTIHVAASHADLGFTLPNSTDKLTSFVDLFVQSKELNLFQGENIQAEFQNLQLQLASSNLMRMDKEPVAMQCTFSGHTAHASMEDMHATLLRPQGNFAMQVDFSDSTAIPVFDCDFQIQELTAQTDSAHLCIDGLSGTVVYKPDDQIQSNPFIELMYESNHLSATIGENFIQTGQLAMDADILHDAQQEIFLLQWVPKGFVSLQDGLIRTASVDTTILIPTIEFDFTPDEYLIRDSRMLIGQSDFQLTGQLNNVTAYLKEEGLLQGDFNFRSHTTDVNHLMNMLSGIGYEENEETVENNSIPDESEGIAPVANGGPFLVPKGMDISLYCSVNEALYAADTARNVEGTVIIKDGIMVLESMLFTTSAAKMQLTAMYRTPRKNHLFMGLDFHLLEIEIEELLQLIPDVDSIMPMLRSFSGTGEFHIAIETYLDSAYNLKKSTLRGASSVRGQDLVLLDGETFSEIAKTLRFNKKTENKIDSLSAEFTVFRNEVDVYPFLIVMDRYKAIVEGKHNLDMTFDYHISLIDSPLPIQLGVDVKGNLDDMKIRPAACKYANMYRPAKRTEVDTKKLALRHMIREALTNQVREE